MKKKLPIAPVRANVRGTWAVQATSMVALPPGSIGCASGTDITVSSFGFSSSGAMKRFEAVRSLPATLMADTSMCAHSSGRRRRSSPRRARARA